MGSLKNPPSNQRWVAQKIHYKSRQRMVVAVDFLGEVGHPKSNPSYQEIGKVAH